MGWERANFFAPSAAEARIEYGWAHQNWHPWVAAEHRACREAVAVFDMSSFAKLVLKRPDAERALQWGFTGPVLRSTGSDYDVRKASPYMLYDRFDFEVPVGIKGDNYDRYFVRMRGSTSP